MPLTEKPKAEVLSPRNAMALDTLAGVRGEMARLYRLALNNKLPCDELTRLIYTLKEIRACLEAEVLVDDQQLVRAGFGMLIEAQDDMTVVGDAADGSAALAGLASTAADVVLMDVRMPVMGGMP